MSKLKITLVKSTVRKPAYQKETALALGLRKMHQTVEVEDSITMKGMVRTINHLITIEKV
jgi:large subunit ribosomal protein L30